MRTCVRILFGLFLLAGTMGPVTAQSNVDSSDPRQVALDIYSGVNRGTEPATIALKLRQAVEMFRYRCTRVTDYQIFTQRPNITDIKVKCSGDPLYGVTVASNGFISVYGGNSILAGLDRRDGIILSFDAEGGVDDTSGFDRERIQEETMSRVMLGGEYDYLYLAGMVMVLIGIMAVGVFAFVRLYRRKQGRKPRSRMKPMKRFRVGYSSELKDRIVDESKEVAKFVFKHDSGIFVAVGKRGKRRLFLSQFGATLYAKLNIRLLEATETEISKIDLKLSDEVEVIEEGEEVQVPR